MSTSSTPIRVDTIEVGHIHVLFPTLEYFAPMSSLTVPGLTHRYRSKKFYNHFDGNPEFRSTPERRDGHYVFNMVRNIKAIYGKKKEDGKKRK